MSARGVFAVDRGIWDDLDFADEAFSEREAFLWLVSEAAWRPTRVRVGSALIDLERGQCAFSTRFMATKWKWSEARVRRFFGRLQKGEIIDAVADAKATKVTIRKYDRFQRVGLISVADTDAPATQPRRTGDAAATQRSETPKHSNNHLPSVDESTRGVRAPKASRLSADWSPDQSDLVFARAQSLTDTEIRVEADKFRDYWTSRAKDATKTDWHATWRTWCRNAVERRGRYPPHGPSGGPRSGGRSPTLSEIASVNSTHDLFPSASDGPRDQHTTSPGPDSSDPRVRGFAGSIREPDPDDIRGNIVDLKRAGAGWT